MENFQLVSIALEALIAILAILASLKGRVYLLGFAVTFGIYVYYDLARHYLWETSADVLTGMFFVATATALYSMWNIYKRN